MSDTSPEIEMLKRPRTSPDLVIDGVHFGRGERHTTIQLKCWKIVEEKLEEIEDELINNFYDSETYIIQWDSAAAGKAENRIFFYWKGERATKGYSPLPEEIEKDNPPVERITQWSEPAVFLRLFSGKLVVHSSVGNQPRLYILRGEIEEEAHLLEVRAKRESLRSRTSFVLFDPKNENVVIWHGRRAGSQCRSVVKKTAEAVFRGKITEIGEGEESEEFLNAVPGGSNDYFVDLKEQPLDYTPRLFYFNKITGNFLATEIECSQRSEYNTSFPFLQSHLYTAIQPATFLLDDDDEIWLWQGWEHDEDEEFKSQCFTTTINYAKQKSKLIEKLVRVQKVIAGFETLKFTNLFPTWTRRDDIVELQKKDGMLPTANLLIEVDPKDNKE